MQVLEPMRCHPIFIPEELIQGHYHGYCKTVMWPLFHNVEMLDSCGCVRCRVTNRLLFAWGGMDGRMHHSPTTTGPPTHQGALELQGAGPGEDLGLRRQGALVADVLPGQ